MPYLRNTLISLAMSMTSAFAVEIATYDPATIPADAYTVATPEGHLAMALG